MGKKIDATGWKMWEHGVPDSRLTVVREYGKDKYGSWLWESKCSCGSEKIVIAHIKDLKSGNTKSCGCLNKERIKQSRTKHGDSNSRLYRVWIKILSRVNNPKDKNYNDYGGRGIVVCNEWLDYSSFREWAISTGYNYDAPQGQYTIERIDVNGNYCPENCRWATQLEQANNKRNSAFLSFNGETHTIAEWSRILNMPSGAIENRIANLHWDVEKALTTPVHNGKFVKCEEKVFDTIKECAEFYGIKYSTLKSWLNEVNPMPDEWKEKGLTRI